MKVRLTRRAAAGVLAAALLGGSAGGVLAARLHGRAAVRPAALHGQMTWAAGTRRAPAFALRDQSGVLVSPARLRGAPVVLTFLDSKCTEVCPLEGRELAAVLQSLPASTRPSLVVVSVDPAGDTPASIAVAMKKWGLAGPWRWHWLRGSQSQLAAVWKEYGVEVEPTSNDIVHGLALYLIDGSGDERSGYLFPFLRGFMRSDLAQLAATRT
ncbi:MAG: SCO family protein [Actinobacteria bacterium]|nr:SCO family protein [Actinomycetota bacterium]